MMHEDTGEKARALILAVCSWGIVFLAGFLLAKALQ